MEEGCGAAACGMAGLDRPPHKAVTVSNHGG